MMNEIDETKQLLLEEFEMLNDYSDTLTYLEMVNHHPPSSFIFRNPFHQL